MTTTVAERPTTTRERFFADVGFTKAPTGTTGDLELAGYASTWGVDRDEEMVSPQAFDDSLPAYLAKNPMLLWQHNPDWPIGSITTGRTDENGLYVTATVPNPGADAADWQKGAYTAIKLGVVKTFSIGGYFTRDVKPGPDGPLFLIVEVELFEISCVSIPANADSIYEAAVKSVHGIPQRMGAKAHLQLEQLVGAAPLTDPELEAMSAEQREERYDLLARTFKQVYSVDAPPQDAVAKVLGGARMALAIEDERKREQALSLVHARGEMVADLLREPEKFIESADGKAGRTISAATRQQLEQVDAAHDEMEAHLVDCAESMKAAASAHQQARDMLGSVLDTGGGDGEDGGGGGDEGDDREDEPPNSPEKAAATPEEQGALIEEQHRKAAEEAERIAQEQAQEAEDFKPQPEVPLGEGAADAVEDAEDAEELEGLDADAVADMRGATYAAKTVLSLASLPFADRDTAWDAGAAKRAVHGQAEREGGGYDPSVLSKAYLWRDDGAPDDQASSYRFIVATASDGKLTYVPRGIFAAAAVVQGARGGTSSEIASALKAPLNKLYSKMASKFGDPSIKPPWSDES